MNTPSKELKRRARAALTGNYFQATSMATSLSLFFFALSLLPHLSGFGRGEDALSRCLYWVLWGIILLLSALMEVGMVRFIYFLKPGQDKKQPSRLFYGFQNQPDAFLITFAFRGLISLVWFVPAITCYLRIPAGLEASRLLPALAPVLLLSVAGRLPALITALPFCLSTYSLLDDLSCSPQDALLSSMQLMKGQKRRMLGLWLGFLPFALLVIGSSGLAFLWVQPYFHASMTQFYLQIKQISRETVRR